MKGYLVRYYGNVHSVVAGMPHVRAAKGRAGDMDLSIINELPPGRSPITTARIFSEQADTVAQAGAIGQH